MSFYSTCLKELDSKQRGTWTEREKTMWPEPFDVPCFLTSVYPALTCQLLDVSVYLCSSVLPLCAPKSLNHCLASPPEFFAYPASRPCFWWDPSSRLEPSWLTGKGGVEDRIILKHEKDDLQACMKSLDLKSPGNCTDKTSSSQGTWTGYRDSFLTCYPGSDMARVWDIKETVVPSKST